MLKRLLGLGRRKTSLTSTSKSRSTNSRASSIDNFVNYDRQQDNNFGPGTGVSSRVAGTWARNQGVRRVPKDIEPLHTKNAVYPPAFMQYLLAEDPAKPGFGHSLRAADAPWIDTARPLGSGSYGSVFAVRVTEKVRRMLRDILDACGNVVRGDLPPVGTSVAIKIAKWRPRDQSIRTFKMDNVREAATHSWMLRHPRVSVPGCGMSLLARDHLPRLYFAGYLEVGEYEAVFVTVMELVHGQPITVQGMTLEKYMALEAAASSLWVSGCMHADLHSGNVMWDTKNHRAVIIDLGFATLLPEPERQAVINEVGRAVVEGVPSLGLIFRKNGPAAHVQKYVNRVLAGRRYDLYWADYLVMLRKYFNRLSAEDKSLLPSLRSRVWRARRQR